MDVKFKSYLLVLLFCLSCSTQADILRAFENYQNKNYQTAFNEYRELAAIGNNQAKYNLAVMYLKGQGTDKNLNLAFAWSKLVDYSTNSEWIDLTSQIKTQLNDKQLSQAVQVAKDLSERYGDQRIFAQLAPIQYQADDENHNETPEYSFEIISRKAPVYPRKELYNGVQGWVRVGFDIHPDGSVRDPFIIESVPEGVFDEVSLKAISNFKMKVTFKPGIEPYPITANQVIQYEMVVRNDEKLKELYMERLNKLAKLATQDHPVAQYYYALAASSQSLVSDYVDMDPATVNTWLFKAAQNGNLDAQYQLGNNILTGKGCKVEKQKGVDWIVLAAEKGHAKSARKAYQLLTRDNHLNNTDKPAEYWLKIAAENGDPESQLTYAHYLAFNHDAKIIPIVKDYLKKYLKKRSKSVKYHQVNAQIFSLQGNNSKAQKELNKAKKMAKKLGWEI